MTEPFTVADKRKAYVSDIEAVLKYAEEGVIPTPPSWWPELGAIDDELGRVKKRYGVQHHDFGFGSKAWAVKADEERRINNRRHDAGNDSWLHIILEEVYEAFAESAEAEDKSPLYGELIQAAAMFVSAAEDLRSREA